MTRWHLHERTQATAIVHWTPYQFFKDWISWRRNQVLVSIVAADVLVLEYQAVNK